MNYFDLEVTKNGRPITESLEVEICAKLTYWRTLNPFTQSIREDKTFSELIGSQCPQWWDSRETELMELSKIYPDLLFTLQAESKRTGCIWCEYYKNGQMESVDVVITFPACTL